MASLNPTTWFRSAKVSQPIDAGANESVRTLSLALEQQSHKVRQLERQLNLRESYAGSGGGLYPWFGGVANPAPMGEGVPLATAAPIVWDPTLNQGIYFNQSMLDVIRAYARWFVAQSPQANGCVNSILDYAVGSGNSYEIQPKRDVRVGKEVLETAERIVDDFCCANEMHATEEDWFKRLFIDAEVFWRLFPGEDGVTKLRTVEPQCIRELNTSPEQLFGVVTAPEDREDILGFNVTYTGVAADGEFVPVTEMGMIKRGTSKQVKRGISPFFCLQSSFEDTMRLFRNSIQGEAARQSLLYILETTGAAGPLVPLNGNGTQANVNGPGCVFNSPGHLSGPTIAVMDKNIQAKPGPVGSSTPAKDLLAEGFRAISTFFRCPVWMVSGSSDSSYAASLVENDPLSMMIRREQRSFNNSLCHLLRTVLRIAEEQGELPVGTVDKLKIVVKNPPAITRDKGAETQRNSVLAAAGLLSPRSWSEAEDLDYDAEKQSIQDTGPAVVPDGQKQAGENAPSSDPAATLERNDPHPLSKS